MWLTEPVEDAENGQYPPRERAAVATRSTRASIGVNTALAAAQVTAGWLSHSQGLIADGIHSLSDLVSDFVVLLASHYGSKGADASHPYGHQRFETAASLALGALLLIVGLGMLLTAVHKLQAPAAIPQVHAMALWVAAASLIAKEVLFRYMLAAAKRVKSSMLVANAWHARSDAASSLVVGIGIIGNLMGYRILDPIAALVIGLLVTRMGAVFGWAAMNDLMDRAVDDRDVEAICRTLRDTPGVLDVRNVRTRKMGDLIMVDAHLGVDGAISVAAGHAIAVAARKRVLVDHHVLDLMAHVVPWEPSDAERPESTAQGFH